MAADRDDGLGCGSVIRQDTTLTADVGPCSEHGLVVEADGVTLDLKGHTIFGDPFARDGQDKAGILLRDVSGVTVTNGTVSGFDAGVAIMGGGGNTVRDVTVEDNVNYRVMSGKNADPEDVDPDNGILCLFGDGITISDSSDNVIEGNRVYGNGPLSGISIVGDSETTGWSTTTSATTTCPTRGPTGDRPRAGPDRNRVRCRAVERSRASASGWKARAPTAT